MCFLYFLEQKKLETKHVLRVFLVLFVFENKKQFSKTVNKEAQSDLFSDNDNIMVRDQKLKKMINESKSEKRKTTYSPPRMKEMLAA